MDRTGLENLAERLLFAIRRYPDRNNQLKTLARSLSASQASLIEAATVLTDWGYRLKVSTKSIRFHSAPDRLIDLEIGYGLKTKIIGRNILSHNSVGSTNDVARHLAERGTCEGTIITAEQQTRGRGRFDRAWHSLAGRGIYLSVILRPKFEPQKAPALSIVAAYALARTIDRTVPGRVAIKWPNDVLISGRKTAGILTELSAEPSKINHIVVGVGINVNQDFADFPDYLRKQATSVKRSVGRKVSRIELLQEFLMRFEQAYIDYQNSGLMSIHSSIRQYSSLIGKEISVKSGRKIMSGLVSDIDLEGRLVLETAGQSQLITAGEVTVLK
jgi:BirA family biotin operon repressor/biotin-[acetyl-CoA-carboxylase] ligase